MTALTWDDIGERIYQTGVDRGVLCLQDGTIVPWNGLISVEDDTSKETMSFYLDGVKYLEYNSPGDFSGKLKAFTYPEEFDDVNGVLTYVPGLHVYDQASKSFNLSYRTKIGNDIDGADFGYLIHLLYNVTANPESNEYTSLGSEVKPVEFTWNLSARPDKSSYSWRPTAHFSIDSREISSEVLKAFEDIFYGTESKNPSFPSVEDLPNLLG